MSQLEEWREIYGAFMVSSGGHIRNLRGRRIIRGYPNADGYLTVCIMRGRSKKTYQVSRLVAAAFLEKPSAPDAEVDHINGRRDDNCVENLRWVSHRENCNNPLTKARYAACAGQKNSARWKNPEYRKAFIAKITRVNRASSRWTDEHALQMRASHALGYTWKEVAEEFGTTAAAVCGLIRRRLGK